ncbi:MAG: XcyI family restriction endonuclease, partial [Chloroflexota bacterium]
DENVDAREFLLWRGMTAGAQADGSWRNLKGDKGEIVAKGMLQRRLIESDLLQVETSVNENSRFLTLTLTDGRIIIFGDEPDIAIYKDSQPLAAIEIKGGIDNAGVLERIGAALKSLGRTKGENPNSITILIMQAVSVSQQAVADLTANQDTVNYWFTMEELLDEEAKRETFFKLLDV